ncbi:hypothetical protein ABLN67_17435, partial [Mycobacterium tuberculosis]
QQPSFSYQMMEEPLPARCGRKREEHARFGIYRRNGVFATSKRTRVFSCAASPATGAEPIVNVGQRAVAGETVLAECR